MFKVEASQPEQEAEGTTELPAKTALQDTDGVQAFTEATASTSEIDGDSRPGEELLAEGLIPPDAGASTADSPVAEPAVPEDVAVSPGNEIPAGDSVAAAQVQIDDTVDPAAASATEASDGAELDPNSTAALIQVLTQRGCISLGILQLRTCNSMSLQQTHQRPACNMQFVKCSHTERCSHANNHTVLAQNCLHKCKSDQNCALKIHPDCAYQQVGIQHAALVLHNQLSSVCVMTLTLEP